MFRIQHNSDNADTAIKINLYLAKLTKKIDLANTIETHFFDNRTYITGKKLSYVKYSSKRSDFLRFYLYLCHVIDDFACLELQH